MVIDVNCSAGAWPFRPLPNSDLSSLSAHLGREGIDRALVSSIEAALLEDPYDANARLFDEARGIETLVPVPVVNPRMRRWRDELEERRANDGLKAVKVHLNYHDVSVGDSEFEDVAVFAAESSCALLLPLRIEDERYHHVKMQVPGVPISDVASFAATHEECTIVCLNAYRNEIFSVTFPSNLYTDIAYAERYPTLEDLVAHTGADRLLFGSNTPFFVTRAARLKIEQSQAADEVKTAVAGGNASALFELG